MQSLHLPVRCVFPDTPATQTECVAVQRNGTVRPLIATRRRPVNLLQQCRRSLELQTRSQTGPICEKSYTVRRESCCHKRTSRFAARQSSYAAAPSRVILQSWRPSTRKPAPENGSQVETNFARRRFP